MLRSDGSEKTQLEQWRHIGGGDQNFSTKCDSDLTSLAYFKIHKFLNTALQILLFILGIVTGSQSDQHNC